MHSLVLSVYSSVINVKLPLRTSSSRAWLVNLPSLRESHWLLEGEVTVDTDGKGQLGPFFFELEPFCFITSNLNWAMTLQLATLPILAV